MSARSNIQWNVFHEDPSVLNARLANIFEPAEYALEGVIFRNLNESDYLNNSIPAVTQMITESNGQATILGDRNDGEGIICFAANTVFEVSNYDCGVIVTSFPTTIEIMSHLQGNSQYDAAQVLSNLASVMTAEMTAGTK